MSDKNRNLMLRVVSAVVLLPAVLYLLWRGGLWAAALIGFAAAMCAFEYYTIVFQGRIPAVAWAGVLTAGAWPLLPLLTPGAPGGVALTLLGALFLAGWICQLFSQDLSQAPGRAAQLVSGLLYPGFGMLALSLVRRRPDGLTWLYAALVLTWANDTCAYFAGRFLGRHKMYPRVSPNKTWEGFAGGFVGSVLGLCALKAAYAPALTALDCVALGAVGGVCGPLGDLCESMLKRAYDVKDSGKMLPGHGGMLDRVDALLFNAPFVLLWVARLRP